MGNYDRNMGGTRFGRVATPRPGEALRLDNRVLGSNTRKQNLTEMSGTSPGKMGSKALTGAPKTPSETGRSPTNSNPGGSNTSYMQDSAPHKQLDSFSVGGPGFPKPWR
jgi:hypothetical protein